MNMKTMLRCALLSAVLLVSGSLSAADMGPVVALRAFFTEVAGQNYAPAWSAFTRRSQDGIVASVAGSEHMTPADVRKLFDADDQRIRAGFWDSFKNSSQAATFVEVAMAPGGALNGSDDSVVMTLPNGNTVALQMFREGGVWKVGWMETFFPDNKVPVSAH